MHSLVFNLLLSSTHQIADTRLSVLSPIGLDVGSLHGEKLPVEAGEEGHEEELLALDPEVVVGVIESPGVGTGLPEHEEVFGAGDEAEGD